MAVAFSEANEKRPFFDSEIDRKIKRVWGETEDDRVMEHLQRFGPNFGRLEAGDKVPVHAYTISSAHSDVLLRTDLRGVYISENDDSLVLKTKGRGPIKIQQVRGTSKDEFVELYDVDVAHVLAPDETHHVLKVFPPPGCRGNATADTELEAIKVLGEAEYPVAKNPKIEQQFHPWRDTLSYDLIPGNDLYMTLKDTIAEGDFDEAKKITNLFGVHLKEVWGGLLDGKRKLPKNRTFPMGDNMLGGFIYTGEKDPRKAFAKVDLLGVDRDKPVTLDKRVRQTLRELREREEFGPDREELVQAFLTGLQEAKV